MRFWLSVITVVMNDLGTYSLDSFVVCFIILGGIVYMYVQGGVIHHLGTANHFVCVCVCIRSN